MKTIGSRYQIRYILQFFCRNYFNPLHMEQLTTATVANSIFAYIVNVSFTAVIYILITYVLLLSYVHLHEKIMVLCKPSIAFLTEILIRIMKEFYCHLLENCHQNPLVFKCSNWKSSWHQNFCRIPWEFFQNSMGIFLEFHRNFSRIPMRSPLRKPAGFELCVAIYRAIFSQLL